ncbi:hypothetical protein GCM10022393_25420 [Aquimarina addita]|uniref:PKD domain-containing protein n=1 Tax=Aquimarina addita TaxID=870485 RepID=A0ABP6ULK3_9FLAO
MRREKLKDEILLGKHYSVKELTLRILVCAVLVLAPIQYAFTHGTVTYPPSRVWVCFQENPESPDSPACEAAIIGWGTQAFYDWSEVARMDAGGMHQAIIQDGNLASAGRPDKFGGLDQTRDDWVATEVEAGPFQITWTNSAPHVTLYYDVYITKADWTPDQPLTWDSLERLVRTDPRPAAATDIIDVVLPPRTGKHVIYSVWQRSRTPEAFYSTSDVDFGTAGLEPTAPVASFTSENDNRCGGPIVHFDASGSSDANGDELTYSWDFGDGTTGEGVEVSHTYTDLTNATVTLTVSDNQFSSGTVASVNLIRDPDCNEIVCPYDTPRESPLPTIQGSYRGIFVVGENGPVLDNHKIDINWNLTNNGLYQFSIQSFGGASVWTNLIPNLTQNFNQANPQVTITGTSYEGLNGSYYVSVDGDNFIMVSTTGDFTIYLSELASDPAPDCGDETPIVTDGGTLSGGPFVFTVGDGIPDYATDVTLSGNVGDNSQYIITDSSGGILGLPTAVEDTDFDGTGEGRCFIYHVSYNGTITGLVVGGTLSTLSGDFDISNSIDVTRNINGGVIENVVYDEDIDGNLSTDNLVPTLIELAGGDNRVISGQTGTVDQANFFTFEIPDGYQLSELIVDRYSGADDIGFIGIDEGEIISGQPANNAPSRLIGGLSYGTANVGTNILPAMGDLDNPAAPFVSGFGFTPPLPSGTYTVWLNQTGGSSSTILNFVLTPTTAIEVDGGIVSGGPFEFTVGDGIADNVSGVSVSGNIGTTSQWVVTDDSGNILGLPITIESVDFDGTGVGTCFIYHLSYNETITGLETNNNLSVLTGDYDLSNKIDVVRTTDTGNPNGSDCTFGTPLSTPLPSTDYAPYQNIYVLGTGGPNLDNITKFVVNWNLDNNGLYQFSFNLSTAPWYVNFSDSVQNFGQANPTITLTGTGIDGLDGTYSAAVDGENFALVGDGYTIYFSNSGTAPDCDSSEDKANNGGKLSFTMFPNPATTSFTVRNITDLKDNVITIYNLAGKKIKSLTVKESTSNTTIDISGMVPGLYMVKVLGSSGDSPPLKLIVK